MTRAVDSSERGGNQNRTTNNALLSPTLTHDVDLDAIEQEIEQELLSHSLSLSDDAREERWKEEQQRKWNPTTRREVKHLDASLCACSETRKEGEKNDRLVTLERHTDTTHTQTGREERKEAGKVRKIIVCQIGFTEWIQWNIMFSTMYSGEKEEGRK